MNDLTIHIKTLSPVHIGTGIRWQAGFEYLHFEKEAKVVTIDEAKIFDIIGAENIDKWVSSIENEENLLVYLRQRKPDIQASDCSEQVIEVLVGSQLRQQPIHEQIRGGRKKNPLIPGSSLKGALRTVILNELIRLNPQFVKDPNHLGVEDRRKGWEFNDKQIIANYFGKKNKLNFRKKIQLDANKDWLRFLRIRDIPFKENKTIVAQTIILNYHREIWQEKRKEVAYWECLPSGVEATSSINIPTQLIYQNKKHKYPIGKAEWLTDLSQLFQLVNQHSLQLINKELAFWKQEQEEVEVPIVIDTYISHLNNLKAQIEAATPKECILRVGAGGGWNNMTGAWAKNENYLEYEVWVHLKSQLRRKKYQDDLFFPKSRTMLIGGIPIGFIKITLN